MMKQTQKIKLVDVARLAGVSCSAAGKVLNGGSKEIRVGEKTRQRILDAAKQLDYHPNMAASILAGGDSKLIGMLLDPGASYRYMRLLQEVERLGAAKGYRILTSFSHDSLDNLIENYRMLLRYGVSGVICCAHDYPQFKTQISDFFAGQRNIVFMEKPAGADHIPCIRTSRVKALTRMIAKAHQRGFRKIGMLCGNHIWQTERCLYEEFHQAMQANGLTVDERLILAYPEQSESLEERMKWVLEQMILPYRPDFLYIDDAPHAAALLAHIQETGMELTIHGGDNNPLFGGMGMRSLDPCYEKIAEAFLYQLHILDGTCADIIETVCL